MKKEMVRRFTWPEILLHWSHAVLYLVLFSTGALLLAGRLSGRPILPRESLGNVHRVSGILLVAFVAQTLLLSILTRDFRCLWRTPLECLRWRRKDVLWLLKVPFNTLTRRVVLPPAGRFNAGQKLHVLVVAVVLMGFSISGLFMILVPGALAAWVVHLACFIPAAVFLALHLFLALINPETRKSLPSMFSGKVTRAYARQHHGLWIDDVDAEHRGSYVSLTTVLIVMGLLVVILALIGVRHRTIPGRETLLATIAQRGTNAISPAPLAAVHASDTPDGRNCAECHSFLAPPSSTKCLGCHDEVGARLAAQSGYHGRLTGPCRQCHQEHKGWSASLIRLDHEAFNHASANFHLQGKHQAVPCEDCHQVRLPSDVPARMQFIGLAHEACTNCHADPHRDERARECLKCHTMESWDRDALTFDHARDSRFGLEGRHANLDCQTCHPRETVGGEERIRLFDIGGSCRDCHDDPHGGQFDKTCEQCHTQQGWQGRWLTPFHTADSPFPLRGRHATLSCEQCHHIAASAGKLAGAKFAGLGRDCQSCHADPHQSQMSLACSTCHRETGWTQGNLLFSHEKHASFKLDGLHSVLACSACHGQEQKRYRPLAHECGACHETQQSAMSGISQTFQVSPDPHNGRLACTDCHDLNKARQSHTEFAARCATCHNPRYADLFYRWVSAFDESRASIKQSLKHIEDPDDTRRLQREQILKDAAAVGFHNLNLTQEILRTGTPTPAENAP